MLATNLAPMLTRGLSLRSCRAKAEVGHHGHDALGAGAFGGIHHQQQLEEVVAGGHGALHNENHLTAHGFLEAGLELPVAEAAHGDFTQAFGRLLRDLLGQVPVAVPLKILALSCIVVGHGRMRWAGVKGAQM
jgi:hypothetical protein